MERALILYRHQKWTDRLAVLEWLAAIPCNTLMAFSQEKWWGSSNLINSCTAFPRPFLWIKCSFIPLLLSEHWVWRWCGCYHCRLAIALLLEQQLGQNCWLRCEPDKSEAMGVWIRNIFKTWLIHCSRLLLPISALHMPSLTDWIITWCYFYKCEDEKGDRWEQC